MSNFRETMSGKYSKNERVRGADWYPSDSHLYPPAEPGAIMRKVANGAFGGGYAMGHWKIYKIGHSRWLGPESRWHNKDDYNIPGQVIGLMPDALLFIDDGDPFLIKGRRDKTDITEYTNVYIDPGNKAVTTITGKNLTIDGSLNSAYTYDDTESPMSSTGKIYPSDLKERRCITGLPLGTIIVVGAKTPNDRDNHPTRYYSPITPSSCIPQKNYTTPNPNKNCTDMSIPPRQVCSFSINTTGPVPPQNCEYVVARLFVGTGNVDVGHSHGLGVNGAIKDYDIMSSPQSWRSSVQTGGIFMRYNHATSIGENVVEYDTHSETVGKIYKIIDSRDNSVFFEPSDNIYKNLLNSIGNPNNAWLSGVQSQTDGQPEMRVDLNSKTLYRNKTFFEKHRIKILAIVLILILIIYRYAPINKYKKALIG